MAMRTTKDSGTITTTAITTTTALCPRCRFHPASPRLGGYCSWDCYEADDEDAEDEEDGDQAA
jgi:hypothetical protein